MNKNRDDVVFYSVMNVFVSGGREKIKHGFEQSQAIIVRLSTSLREATSKRTWKRFLLVEVQSRDTSIHGAQTKSRHDQGHRQGHRTLQKEAGVKEECQTRRIPVRCKVRVVHAT